jgi:hypothetical protein
MTATIAARIEIMTRSTTNITIARKTARTDISNVNRRKAVFSFPEFARL